MKKTIKKIMPQKINDFIYTLIFNKKIKREFIEKKNWENKIINNILYDKKIKDGPFKDMLYTETAFCSAILPKLIGTYEEPIQTWICEAINKKYIKIINIGSAEGYYSVGLAIKSDDSLIYAYDIDNKALEENIKVAKLNKVENRIFFRNICDHNELNNIIDEKTLIICDIEGAEIKLLDPQKCPSLIKADLIIESHDSINKKITQTLINRFFKTHKIEIIVDYQRNTQKAEIYSKEKVIIKTMLDEKRPEAMKWLRLTKISL